MKTIEILGEKAEYYLSHVCRTIDKSQLYLPAHSLDFSYMIKNK